MSATVSATISAFIISGISKLSYCLLIIIICLISIKFSTKIINKFFASKAPSAISINKASTLSALLSGISKYAIVLVGICAVLISLGVPPATLTAVLGTGTVAIGLATQSVVKDAIAGFFILFENQFSVGDTITIEGKTGIVEDITIRKTLLRSDDGVLHLVPNGSISIVSNNCK